MNLLLSAGALLCAFIIVVIVIPTVVKVARAKKLFEPLEGSKISKKIFPPFGGVAIFLAFIISSVIFTGNVRFPFYNYLISSIVLLFFLGLKSDILYVSVPKKNIIKILAAAILIFLGDLRITGFHGIVGIHNISFTVSIIISLIIILLLINAFSLIDCIDGLSSGLALVASFVLGSWFIVAGHIQYAVLSFSLAGSLAGFFIYNVFGNKNKLILGDSGAMIIGLIISVLIIRFNELNLLHKSYFSIKAAPSVSLACVICPLADMFRVIVIRLLFKKSSSHSVNNPVYHKLLAINPKHIYVTSVILTENIILIVVALAINTAGWDVTLQFISILTLGIIFSFLPYIIKHTEYKQKHIAHANYRD